MQTRRVDAHQHLVCLDDRLVDFLDTEDIGWAVLIVDDRSHRRPGGPAARVCIARIENTPVVLTHLGRRNCAQFVATIK
jgi:hypothetical protein